MLAYQVATFIHSGKEPRILMCFAGSKADVSKARRDAFLNDMLRQVSV